MKARSYVRRRTRRLNADGVLVLNNLPTAVWSTSILLRGSSTAAGSGGGAAFLPRRKANDKIARRVTW